MRRAVQHTVVVIATGILLLMLAACGQNAADKWQEQYDLGVRYLSEGNYQEAILSFTSAIEIEPMNADAYVQLAQIHLTRMDYPAAEKIIKQGIDQTDDARLKELLDELQIIYAHSYSVTIRNETPQYGVLRAYHLIENDTVSWAYGNGAEIESGGIVSYDNNYVSFDVEDIAEGYRIKSVMWNGEDQTSMWIYGFGTGCSFYIEEDVELVLTMEEIPSDLPIVPHATITERQENLRVGRELVAVLDSDDFPFEGANFIWEYRDPTSNEWVSIPFWEGYAHCSVEPFGGQTVDLTGKYIRVTVCGRDGYSTGSYTTDEYFVSE